MKRKIIITVLFLFCMTALFAQAPGKFTYQMVVRNSNNQLVINSLVGVRVTILQNFVTGNAVYSETQMLSTNANGLVTMNIGEGTVVYGSFAAINWSAGTFFLKSEIDPTGGSSYSITSTQQLLSVPYALYANEAGNGFSGNYNDLENLPQIPQVPADVSAFTNDAGYITSADLQVLLDGLNSRVDSLQTVLDMYNIEIATLSNAVDSLGAFADSLGHIIDECGCLTAFHCSTSTIVDYDGNVYSTIKLGSQCWMAENLRTRHYSNGDPIELGSSTSTTIPYRYNPANDSANVGDYGYLYNWAAVMNGAISSEVNPSGVQGICPTGWHVPSDVEWVALKDYVSSQSQYVCNNNSSNIGKALASATGWNNSTTTACGVGTMQSTNNASGFNALPAGNYYATGSNGFGFYANFWTSTEATSGNAYSYNLAYTSPSLNRSNSGGASGFSVRCVQD